MPFLGKDMIFMEDTESPEIEFMLGELYKMHMNRAEQTEPTEKIKKAYKHLFKTLDESPYRPKSRL
jgi:prolyl-tRNA synthetase